MASCDSPLKVIPAKRARKSINEDKCIVCQDTKQEKIVIAQSVGKNALVTAAEARKDTLLVNHVHHSDKIVYHKSCYCNYTSKHNLQVKTIHQNDEPDMDTNIPSTSTRASATPASINNLCIICQKKTHKKDIKLILVSTKNCELNLRTAAVMRKDDEMLHRIGPEDCSDLIAQDAVYHISCLASYTSKRNLSATLASDYRDEAAEGNVYDTAFKKLLSDIEEDLIHNGKAFNMSLLLATYTKYLPDDAAQSYRASKLEKRLIQHFGENITIKKSRGQGQSNVVLSSQITIGDAIEAGTQLKNQLKHTQETVESDSRNDVDCGEDKDTYQTIYHAVAVLREVISKIPKDKQYPSPQEVSLEASENFIPKQLAVAMKWLIDKNAFESADPDFPVSEEVKRIYLTLAECIAFSTHGVMTPFHIGLAVQLHHEYGKRAIIDLLHAYRLCISYDELRRFLTSAATDQLTNESDVYIPPEIIPVTQGGGFIQEGDDNIDINARTLDGKDTFHAMARVVFQERSVDDPVALNSTKVNRGHRKSLQLTDTAASHTQCKPFVKPVKRPEPPKMEEPTQKLEECCATARVRWVLYQKAVCDGFRFMKPVCHCESH